MSKKNEIPDHRAWAADVLSSWATTYEDMPANKGWKQVTRLVKIIMKGKPISAKDYDEILFHLWQKYAENLEGCEENHIDARIEIINLIDKWHIDKEELVRSLTKI
jgi:hypothetical protein